MKINKTYNSADPIPFARAPTHFKTLERRNKFENKANLRFLLKTPKELTQIRLSKRLCQKSNEAWSKFCQFREREGDRGGGEL